MAKLKTDEGRTEFGVCLKFKNEPGYGFLELDDDPGTNIFVHVRDSKVGNGRANMLDPLLARIDEVLAERLALLGGVLENLSWSHHQEAARTTDPDYSQPYRGGGQRH
jgi:hypothetical protein